MGNSKSSSSKSPKSKPDATTSIAISREKSFTMISRTRSFTITRTNSAPHTRCPNTLYRHSSAPKTNLPQINQKNHHHTITNMKSPQKLQSMSSCNDSRSTNISPSIISPQISKQCSSTLSSPPSFKRSQSPIPIIPIIPMTPITSITTTNNNNNNINNNSSHRSHNRTLSPHGTKYLTNFKYYYNKHQYNYNQNNRISVTNTTSPLNVINAPNMKPMDTQSSDSCDSDITFDDETEHGSMNTVHIRNSDELQMAARDSNSSTHSHDDSSYGRSYSIVSGRSMSALSLLHGGCRSYHEEEKYEHDDPMKDIATNDGHRQIEVNNGINGITGKYISLSMVQIVYDFWMNRVELTSIKKKQEISCAIYFELIELDPVFHRILYKQCQQKKGMKITDIAHQMMTILGVIFKCLIRNDINLFKDLFKVIRKYQLHHFKYLLNVNHIDLMIKAVNTTFAHYFDRYYVVEVKFAMEYTLQCIGYIALSDGDCDDLNFEYQIKQRLIDRYDQTDYLLTTQRCLNCGFGREYLFHFIHQTSCDELVFFLKEYFNYKTKTTSKEKLMIIQQIIKKFIHPNSMHCLNLSYDCRRNIIERIKPFNYAFEKKQPFELPHDFFDECYVETIKLILENHWTKFVRIMRKMRRLIIFNEEDMCLTPMSISDIK